MIDFAALQAANRPVNAFVDWDEAAVGRDGPLVGLTVGIKANIAVKGLPWTAGAELYRGRVAERDAAVVAGLRDAGAAILGTLNMDEAALGTTSDNPWYGPVRNPHRLSLTAGGSSGGSAAAVAAGLCDVALGTDTMGSIRIPAAFCGVYGFKPAAGAVEDDGLEPCERSFDAIGPLARSLDRLEQVARVMGAVGDGSVEPKAATLISLGGVECDPAVVEAYDQTSSLIGRAGEFGLPHPLSRIRFAGFIATARALAAHLASADPALLSPMLQHLLAYGAERAPTKWAEDQAILAETRAALTDAIDRHGLILLPTAPHLPHDLGEAPPADQADFTCLANFAGLPALSLPAGWSDDGRPAAVQLIGRPGVEAGLFAAARVLDAELGAYRRPDHFYDGGKP